MSTKIMMKETLRAVVLGNKETKQQQQQQLQQKDVRHKRNATVLLCALQYTGLVKQSL